MIIANAHARIYQFIHTYCVFIYCFLALFILHFFVFFFVQTVNTKRNIITNTAQQSAKVDKNHIERTMIANEYVVRIIVSGLKSVSLYIQPS